MSKSEPDVPVHTRQRAVAERKDEDMRDPKKFIIINGEAVEAPAEHEVSRMRRIEIGGVNYEQVSVDAHGRWVYRAM